MMARLLVVSAAGEVAGREGFPGLFIAGRRLGEFGDAVAEGVGGVIIGQMAQACSLREELLDVVAGVAEAGELRGQDG